MFIEQSTLKMHIKLNKLFQIVKIIFTKIQQDSLLFSNEATLWI